MTTALLPEHDPYVLAAPAPDSPVVTAQWISSGNHHANSRYRDLTWSLAPLIDNPGASLTALHWKNCPEALRGQVKLAAWTMINGQLRPTLLQTRGVRARARSSASDLRETCREWLRLARWLCDQGVTDLAACGREEWSAYAAQRWDDGIGRDGAVKVLGRLTDLWVFDNLTLVPTGVIRPPWDTEGADDYLPPAEAAGRRENTTEPLSPGVIGPLLVWSIRMVEDFADDIMAAWAENRRLTDLATSTPPTPAGQAALAAFLLPRIEAGTAIPATARTNTTPQIARTFIAATTGSSLRQVDRFARRHGLGELATRRPGPASLDVPITGLLDGRPWREHLDFAEAGELMRHLGTAAVIICLYLTGMRPQENGAELHLMQHSGGSK
ncbi:hypothetical protein P3T27_005806 [Kitasatospora sp. MAA19]|uniref:hypothetical protein n=1 Tax=unclassified Kitasatospora TaxID=2633591 RepID=UPI0024771C3F|nr:hypothetical protein [Kitasatospora sp. MAA19]MDH6709060.1 hypothetical protein [Kitasatospora sp. MAA19]